jgi:prevent-host-death family protein
MVPARVGRHAVGVKPFLARLRLTRSVDQVGLAQFNMYEARTHFSRLVERAATGEEIVIARAGEPIAKLVPYRYVEQRVPGVVTARIVLDSMDLPRDRL